MNNNPSQICFALVLVEMLGTRDSNVDLFFLIYVQSGLHFPVVSQMIQKRNRSHLRFVQMFALSAKASSKLTVRRLHGVGCVLFDMHRTGCNSK